MADGIIALILIHHCEALVFVGQVITAHFQTIKKEITDENAITMISVLTNTEK